MKAKKEKIMKKRITLKRLCALMASALLLFCVLPSQAQNVTVKPSTGSMIAAVPEQIEGIVNDTDRELDHTFITAMGLLRVGIDTLVGTDEDTGIRAKLAKLLKN